MVKAALLPPTVSIRFDQHAVIVLQISTVLLLWKSGSLYIRFDFGIDMFLWLGDWIMGPIRFDVVVLSFLVLVE